MRRCAVSSISTARSYRSLIERYLLPHLGRVPLVERDCKNVAAMFWAIDKNGGVAGRPLSAVTLHRNYATLSAPWLVGYRLSGSEFS